HDDGIGCLSISPDGHWLMTGAGTRSFNANDKTIRVWDLKTDDPAATVRILRGHDSPIQCIAISSDGHWLVSGDEDRNARLWNLQADDPAMTSRTLRGHKSPVRCMS